jgi:methylmalonyl-CoA mutase N-terminal domain/subunit
VTPDKQDPQDSPERSTDSGIEIKPVYRAADLDGWDPGTQLGDPGTYPYTRGVHPQMYRSKLWTMRQYAGFGSAEATNERFKFLLDAGQTGLSCAFDLPTQMGYDSDHPRAEGEVGKVGVAIDSLADMRLLMAGLPMDTVTTSMTINATGAILLLLYQLVAEEQGVPGQNIRGTIQNDILKEYIARGTYIYPPTPSAIAQPTCPTGTPYPFRDTTSARPALRPCRRSRSPWRTALPTWRRPLRRAWTSTRSRLACPSSGMRTTICSKRSPSTARRGVCGRAS